MSDDEYTLAAEDSVMDDLRRLAQETAAERSLRAELGPGADDSASPARDEGALNALQAMAEGRRIDLTNRRQSHDEPLRDSPRIHPERARRAAPRPEHRPAAELSEVIENRRDDTWTEPEPTTPRTPTPASGDDRAEATMIHTAVAWADDDDVPGLGGGPGDRHVENGSREHPRISARRSTEPWRPPNRIVMPLESWAPVASSPRWPIVALALAALVVVLIAAMIYLLILDTDGSDGFEVDGEPMVTSDEGGGL